MVHAPRAMLILLSQPEQLWCDEGQPCVDGFEQVAGPGHLEEGKRVIQASPCDHTPCAVHMPQPDIMKDITRGGDASMQHNLAGALGKLADCRSVPGAWRCDRGGLSTLHPVNLGLG